MSKKQGASPMSVPDKSIDAIGRMPCKVSSSGTIPYNSLFEIQSREEELDTRGVSFILISLCALSLIMPVQLAAQVATEMPQLQKPSLITLQGDRLYVVEESRQIHIFQKKDGRYAFLKTFGKTGEGPGEFGGYIFRIRIKADHLEIPTQNRLARFDFNGRFLDEIRLPIPVIKGNITRFGQNYVAWRLQFDNKDIHSSIRLYGPDFVQISEIASQTITRYRENTNPVGDLLRYQVNGDQIYVARSSAIESSVLTYNLKGELTRELTLFIQGERVNSALKGIILKPDMDDEEYLKSVVFPDQTPGFDYFEVIDQGFAVRTYRYNGDLVDFAFFDSDGRELKCKALFNTGSAVNGRLFAFHQGKYLYLQENIDQEVWELLSEGIF
jgi:hypothetical protein